MSSRRISAAALALALVGVGWLWSLAAPERADARSRSRVFLNGEPILVRFSDGDSFRTYSGPYPDTNTRIQDFNTLESFAPAHQWGDWHPFELYVNAKKATLNARRGVWHCTTEGELDTYDRLLVDCPDLVVDQIRSGLAHAYSIDETPARPEYLRAQREAIRHRRGMWAHGVPDFIVTSVHSAVERQGGDYEDGELATYNRMVSTRDGHTEKWRHDDDYEECTWVCATEIRADDEAVRQHARRIRADSELAPLLSDTSNLLLIEIVDRYARLKELPEWVEPELASRLRPRLAQARDNGDLGQVREVKGSCMIHVPFKRRYGSDKAECLKGRGNWEAR